MGRVRSEELKSRTKTFGVAVMKLVEELPRTALTEVFGRQLLRCTTSVGANYRAACRSRSQADFVSKMGIVEEEADESAYWLEYFLDASIGNKAEVARLFKEANELTAIFTASGRTARRNSS